MSELKAINAHGVRKDDGSYYDRRQVDKYIDELDERHTTEITALEVSYKLQLDGLRYDKDAEIRRLKRALWIAHEYKSKFKRWWLHLALDCEASAIRPDTKTLNRIRGKIGNCEKSERKCRAKAEEYK